MEASFRLHLLKKNLMVAAVVVSLLASFPSVGAFQNAHTLIHSQTARTILISHPTRSNSRIRNTGESLLPQQQRSLHYKATSTSSSSLGDYELHSFWFPEQQQQQEVNSSSNVVDVVESRRPVSSTATSTTSSLPQSPKPTPSSINNRHSSADWLYNLRTIPSSTVLRETKGPVVTLASWATAVSIIYQVLKWCGNHTAASKLTMPHSAHSFVVSSLGLLLVFRTNSAYQRFLEGRRIWESIHSISRNVSRLLHLYQPQMGIQRMYRLKHLLATFPYLLRHHVRSGCLCQSDDSIENLDPKYRLLLHHPTTLEVVDTRYEGDKTCGGTTHVVSSYQPQQSCFVDRRDLPWSLLEQDSYALRGVCHATHKPLWILDRMGQELMSIKLSPDFGSRERMSLLNHVERLSATIGQCERIHQTSVPLNYARHALRGLSVWLFTLPFALIQDLGLLTGPVTAVMAWLLFGIYQIGYHVEDPFQGSLRLSILCEAIRKDLLDDQMCTLSAFENLEEQEEAPAVLPSFRFDPNQLRPLPLVMDGLKPPFGSCSIDKKRQQLYQP